MTGSRGSNPRLSAKLEAWQSLAECTCLESRQPCCGSEVQILSPPPIKAATSPVFHFQHLVPVAKPDKAPASIQATGSSSLSERAAFKATRR